MGSVPYYLELYREFDPPYERFERSMLGLEFPAELDLVSRLWFRCGYRPGIGAYLNFFLLRDFIRTHDTNFPPRFASATLPTPAQSPPAASRAPKCATSCARSRSAT